MSQMNTLNQNNQSSNSHKYLTMAPLFLVLVIDTMGAGIIFPILSPLFLDRHESILAANTSLSLRQIWYGVTLTSWGALMFIGAPYLGDLSDRLGRKKVLMLALAGTAVGFIISALGIDTKSLSLLIIGRLIAGFFSGSQPIAQAVIADISSDNDKVLFMSLIIVANCIGFIIGPIVGGYFADPDIVSWFSYSTPFYLAGLFALINSSLLLITLRETYQPKPDVQLNLTKGLVVFAEAFTSKRVRVFALILFLVELAWSIFFLYIPIYLVEHFKYDNLNIAHYMSAMGIVFAFALTAIIRVLHRFLNLENMVISVVTMMAIAVFLIPQTTGYNIWWMSFPIAIGTGIGYSVLITICSNQVTKDEQGWVMGLTSSVVAAAFGIGSMLAGTLGTFGKYFPFYVAGMLSLLSVALLIWKTKSNSKAA